MNDIIRILLTLTLASLGGYVFYKLKVPGGAMIGAMVAAIILTLTTGLAYIPRNLRVFIQMFVGMKIGSNISKKDVLDLRNLLIPTAILIVSMVLLDLVFGTLMATIGGLDLTTALFSCSPGGMADMAIIADEMGANAVYIVVLQLSRILFIYIALPPVFRRRLKKDQENQLAEALLDGIVSDETEKEAGAKVTLTLRQKTIRFIATMAAGISFGFLFWQLGVKAGALLGSMIGVAVLNMATGFTFFPKQFNLPMRFVSGSYIGQQMDMESLIMMTSLGVPILIMWLGVLAFTFVVPLIITKFSRLDLATSMLSSVPGGTQEMSLLAEDLGADVPKVALLQTVRQVSVLVIFPTMVSVISILLT